MTTRAFGLLFVPVCMWILLAAHSPAYSQDFERGVVAADHPAASEAGAEMLRRGGNVVDAAIATSFALSVVRPASCGIGGGGFMVIWDAKERRAVVIDYRERAPLWASREMYDGRGDTADSESASIRGGLAPAVPGTVAGLCYAAESYGSLPLNILLEPALRLCETGVPVDEHDLEVQTSALKTLRKYPAYSQTYDSLLRLYLNNGKPWQIGDLFYSPQGPALRRIASHGASGFYDGETARELVRVVAEHGGKIGLDDLKVRIPAERVAVQGEFRGAQIFTMPPPSSGGIALLQSLSVLEEWEHKSARSLNSLGHNSPEYLHLLTESLKHAFADRAEFLGDSDFVDVPIQKLLDRKYAAETASHIDENQTLRPEEYGRFFGQDDAGTSHFSVMDHQGNAVACTETINLTFGSFVVLPESGVLLNNQMDDFAAQPGQPNAFGLLQSEANVVAPGKKPLSSMTPTILVRDGKAELACGGSGGPRIITATIQTVLNHEVFGMSPAESVSAPRIHHQWFPDELLSERKIETDVDEKLRSRGHVVEKSGGLAAVQAVAPNVGGTKLSGGSDPRKHGRPAGN
ncbi:MAG: gamma-glutamyltransferase [Planctomyces sp.]|nr:gamma-glutamyltransferase [Planctomyces sp.]